MTRFNNYDLPGQPPVLSWNPVVMRCPGCGLDADPTFHEGHANKRCWHLRACDMHAMNPKIPAWKRDIKSGVSPKVFDSAILNDPITRKRPTVIATQFMGDIGQAHPRQQEWMLWAAIIAPQHIFLWLTKWPENLAHLTDWPENVWLGTSVSTQEDAETRVPKLLAVNARHHWLSVEPMQSRIELNRLRLSQLEFVAAGPETGPRAFSNPAVIEWMDWLAFQCRESGVPFYDKRDPSDRWHIRREWPTQWIDAMENQPRREGMKG